MCPKGIAELNPERITSLSRVEMETMRELLSIITQTPTYDFRMQVAALAYRYISQSETVSRDNTKKVRISIVSTKIRALIRN